MKTTFEIIEKSYKFNLITKNNILVLFLFLLIFLASFLQKILFFKVLGMISILLLTIFFCTKSFRIANFEGKIIGKLIFYDSKISINEREIFIYDLKSIFLRMNDYYGKQKSYKTTIPLSNGTNNLLDLELKSGEKIKLFLGSITKKKLKN